MAYGYSGKILRVDLSSGKISFDEHDAVWYRRFFGGAAATADYLLREMAPGTDPLGPDNVLIFAPGVITGVPASGTARNGIGARSPLTGGIAKSEVGGQFGAELKMAGLDGIVFTGKAERPVYLWVKDGEAELRDASDLWGRPVMETAEAIKAEVGERLAKVATIGLAGEKLVRIACINQDLKDSAGRGGLGAVMGSKNLKAIAVRGTQRVPVADKETVTAIAKEVVRAIPERALGYKTWGTGSNMPGFNAIGNIPTRNYRDGYFENIERTTPQAMKETGILVAMEGCSACAVRCKRAARVQEPWVADPRYGGPEYETLGAFGSNCGVDDLKALARAHHLCQHYGIDTISAGATISFAMECFERGYLSKADFDGLEPVWGNAEALLELIERIGERRGIGDLLAEGSKRAAAQIGRGAEELAIQVKGLEIGMHEPRLKAGLGLGYAVCNIGGDHCVGLHDTLYESDGTSLKYEAMPFGVLEPMPAGELSTRKVEFFRQRHRWTNFLDSALCCIFVPWDYAQMARFVNAVTGWNTTVEELLLVGERAITMGRAFNVREGFGPEDDQLPKRFYSPPPRGYLAERKQAIDPENLARAVKTYYHFMGWDQNGVPTRETLERLSVGWVADKLNVASVSE